MERTIGNLGSNPFANLARRALQRSQVNALKSIYPELDPKSKFQLPCGAMGVEDGYVMLQPRDRYPVEIPGHLTAEALAQAVTAHFICKWNSKKNKLSITIWPSFVTVWLQL
jgi:hypothetical protein